jgi:hypothetical protein
MSLKRPGVPHSEGIVARHQMRKLLWLRPLRLEPNSLLNRCQQMVYEFVDPQPKPTCYRTTHNLLPAGTESKIPKPFETSIGTLTAPPLVAPGKFVGSVNTKIAVGPSPNQSKTLSTPKESVSGVIARHQSCPSRTGEQLSALAPRLK